MYTYTKADNTGKDRNYWYDIRDPDGDIICQVVSRGEAEAIVSHLNRQQ